MSAVVDPGRVPGAPAKSGVTILGRRVSWDALVVAGASLLGIIVLYRLGKPTAQTAAALPDYSGQGSGSGTGFGEGMLPSQSPIPLPGNPAAGGGPSPIPVPVDQGGGAPSYSPPPTPVTASGPVADPGFHFEAQPTQTGFWRWTQAFASSHGLDTQVHFGPTPGNPGNSAFPGPGFSWEVPDAGSTGLRAKPAAYAVQPPLH